MLRPYQQKVIDDITEVCGQGKRKIILQAATGAGKTIIASAIIKHAVQNLKRILFMAHRRELIWQASEKLKDVGIEHGILMGDHPHDPSQLVQVSSIQSLHSKAIKRKTVSHIPADLVIVDEAHHSASSNTWRTILDNYPSAIILGLTATPINRGGVGLGNCFDTIVRCPSISELIAEGFLVPARYYVPSLPDLRGLRVQAGDYVESELEARMDQKQLIGDVCQNWSRIAPNRKTLVFGCSVKHSQHLCENFRAIGIKAEHVDGKTPEKERDKIVESFKNGDTQVLCNCAVFQEGFDVPQASCLVFARPTKSLLLYLQVVGRVLRPSEGKKDCIVIDHAGAVYEHGTVDQDWDWRLEYGSEKNINNVMRSKIKFKKKAQITCGNCKEVYEFRIDCPSCGWKPKFRGQEVQTFEAYLQELTALEAPKGTTDEKTWFLGFKWYAEQHKYSPGWAAWKYKEKFNKWPGGAWKHLEAIEPPRDVLAYIRHLQIKWARSQPKTEAWKWKQTEIIPLQNRPDIYGGMIE